MVGTNFVELLLFIISFWQIPTNHKSPLDECHQSKSNLFLQTNKKVERTKLYNLTQTHTSLLRIIVDVSAFTSKYHLDRECD